MKCTVIPSEQIAHWQKYKLLWHNSKHPSQQNNLYSDSGWCMHIKNTTQTNSLPWICRVIFWYSQCLLSLLSPVRNAWIQILDYFSNWSLIFRTTSWIIESFISWLTECGQTTNSLPAILCFLSGRSDPGASRGTLMGWPMQDISGPILALHFPYLPISAEESSILISAECQREPVGERESAMEKGWKEGVHLIRPQRIREDLGERGPNVLGRGTSSLSNYHRVIFFFFFLFSAR